MLIKDEPWDGTLLVASPMVEAKLKISFEISLQPHKPKMS